MNRRVEMGLMILALLFSVACSSEPQQTQPVITKSDSGTSTAPPAKDAQQRDKALVRVINAVPGSRAFDIFAGDQKVFESVTFKSVTPYKELADDRQSFRVRSAGQDSTEPLAENSEGLSGGKHYTFIVMADTTNNTTLHVVNDNITTPPADKAQVRVIHASADAGEVDVVDKQGNKMLFSGVNFERGTSYMDVDPTKTTLEVRPEGQDKAIATVPNANFQKGKFYTIVVTGHAKAMPKLQTIVVEDQLGNMSAASASPEEKMEKTKATKY